MDSEKLTTKEVAVRLGMADVTVRMWCRQGKFPNAHAMNTPRGDIWYIPESDLVGFQKPQAGRPKGSGKKEVTETQAA